MISTVWSDTYFIQPLDYDSTATFQKLINAYMPHFIWHYPGLFNLSSHYPKISKNLFRDYSSYYFLQVVTDAKPTVSRQWSICRLCHCVTKIIPAI